MDKFVIRGFLNDSQSTGKRDFDSSGEWLSTKHPPKKNRKLASSKTTALRNNKPNHLPMPSSNLLKEKTSTIPNIKKESPKEDSDPWNQIAKQLCSPTFKEEYKRVALNPFDKNKEIKVPEDKFIPIPNAVHREISPIPEEESSKENSDPWNQIAKQLCSPTFKEEYKRVALNAFDRNKELASLKEKCMPIRNAEVRTKLMHGYDCRCCAPYYDALNLSPGERERRINQVSRHRGFQPMPDTPERYWDVAFPATQEQRNLGLVVETDSPLYKSSTSSTGVAALKEKCVPAPSSNLLKEKTSTIPNIKKESPKEDSDPWNQIAKQLCSPTFKEEYKRVALNPFDKNKEIKVPEDKFIPIPNAVHREISPIPEEESSKENSDPWNQIAKQLCSPTFKEEYKRVALNAFDRNKELASLKEKCIPIRNAEVRTKLMHGYDCRCCAPYYDALNLSPGERERRINQVSRHRGFQPMPDTPERYWDVAFPATQEQRNLGLVVETDSPLYKPKLSLFRNNGRTPKIKDHKPSGMSNSLTPKMK